MESLIGVDSWAELSGGGLRLIADSMPCWHADMQTVTLCRGSRTEVHVIGSVHRTNPPELPCRSAAMGAWFPYHFLTFPPTNSTHSRFRSEGYLFSFPLPSNLRIFESTSPTNRALLRLLLHSLIPTCLFGIPFRQKLFLASHADFTHYLTI